MQNIVLNNEVNSLITYYMPMGEKSLLELYKLATSSFQRVLEVEAINLIKK